MTARTAARTLALLLTATALAACTTAPQARESVNTVQMSRAVSFDSLKQLAAASKLIVVATVGRESTVEYAGAFSIPFTVMPLEDVRVLAGEATPPLRVRQPGRPEDVSQDTPKLTPGSRYLLFLEPFQMVAGDNTGQWVLTGQAGAYGYDGSAFYKRLDEYSPKLPGRLTEREAADVAHANGLR